jgi:glycosyltransferase involved in cell wall biosynthesis
MQFSVLMSVYDKENPDFLDASLRSILVCQTLLPTQVVVVKDGPINKCLDAVLEKYKEIFPGLIDTVQLSKNMGLGVALNVGLLKCKYEIVARMDSDDISVEDRFSIQIPQIQRLECAVIGGWQQDFDKVPHDLGTVRKVPERNDQIRRFAKYRNPLNHPTVVFRKAVVERVGGYREFYFFEDYYLWYRILRSDVQIVNIPEVLLHGRVGNNMIDRRRGLKYMRSEIKLHRIMFDDGFISWPEFLVVVMFKTGARMLPKNLLSVLYSTFLRSSK